MFSQFSEFTNFASKLSAELSLDNLQKEQEQHPDDKLCHEEQVMKSDRTTSISAPISSISMSPLSSKNTSINESKLREYEEIIKEKSRIIESLSTNLTSSQYELDSIKKLQSGYQDKIKYYENKLNQMKDMDTIHEYQLLQTKYHDLQMELTDLQLHYQSKFTENQDGQNSAANSCLSCSGYQTQIEEMRHDFEVKEQEYQITIDNLNKRISKLQKENKTLEKDLHDTTLKVTASESQPVTENTHATSNVDQLYKELEIERANMRKKDDDIHSLQLSLDEIQKAYNELKDKQQHQTAKMKEKVKEFIESQRVLQTENTSLSNEIKSKDVEIQALEKKIYALTQRNELSSELTERYSEAQRELTKRNIDINQLKERIQSLEASFDENQIKLAQKESELLHLTQLHDTLQKTFEEFQKESQYLQESMKEQSSIQLEKSVNQLNEKIEAILLEKNKNEKELTDMHAKYQALKIELESSQSNSQSFDEYKVRAQKTLKQANSTITTLNTKVTTLEEDIKTKDQRIQNLQEEIKISSVERDRLQNELNELSNSLGLDRMEYEREILQLQDLSQRLTLELDSYKKQLELRSHMTEERLPLITFNKKIDVPPPPRISMTPDIVVLGSGSDEDIQLKSDEDGVVISGKKQQLNREAISSEIGSDSNQLAIPDHSTDLYLIYQLRDSIGKLHQELAERHHEIEDLRLLLQQERENKAKVVRQLDELNAFHERTKKLLNSPDSAVNIEYLKKCVYRLMVTKELSEKRSLYPVISVILKFTPQETANITRSIEDEIAHASGDGSWSRFSELASNSIGSIFGNA